MYIPILLIHTHPFLHLEYSHKTCSLECCFLTDSLYSMTPVPRIPITLVLSVYTHSSSIQHPSFIPSIWVLCWIFPVGSHHTAPPQCRRGGWGWASWVLVEAAPWTRESTQTLRYWLQPVSPRLSKFSCVKASQKFQPVKGDIFPASSQQGLMPCLQLLSLIWADSLLSLWVILPPLNSTPDPSGAMLIKHKIDTMFSVHPPSQAVWPKSLSHVPISFVLPYFDVFNCVLARAQT